MKMKTENHGWLFLWGLLTLVSFCFIGCKDDDGGEKGALFGDLVYYCMEIILAMIRLK